MLEIRGLDKSYAGTPVLRDVSFDVAPGRLTGFVGRNGAGKTTTMRIVLGVLEADSGTVSLDGRSLARADRSRFGYMPEERGLYPKMPLHEQLVYLARLHGVATADARRRATSLLDDLELGARRDDPVEKLSLGNQQRAQIAAALVHDPQVLVLDEPFSGLDPVAVDKVLEVLRGYAEAGAPVLFSSHQLDLVERLCDDLVVIADGTIRAAGSRDALRDAHAGNEYELEADDPSAADDEPGIRVTSRDPRRVAFEADDAAAAQRLLRRALDAGAVTAFRRRRPDLAEVFREVIR
jgi:ABC-2 type transport system ATP-binding protein